MRITLDSFVNVIERSELLDTKTLQAALKEFQASNPGAPEGRPFAEFLVKKGLLTVWQADKLLQAKHRGFTLGRYRLLQLLGKGGMSSVYLAEHMVMKRRCAVKVLPARKAKNSAYLNRFHREARAVASLDHPNIVRAYDIDQVQDGSMELHFLVMEYIQGKTLFEIVRTSGPLPVAKAVDFIRQAAQGLDHAHKAGLIHRDVKPENLILDRQGVVKVMDLGLARFYESDEEQLTVHQDERVLGTANYCSPEQAVDSHTVDARTDIYSLGCTIYYFLMGQPPFNTGTLAQRLMAHQTKEPPPIQSKRPDVSDEIVKIVRRMMAKSPVDRFQSMEEIFRALTNVLSSNPPTEAAPGSPQPFSFESLTADQGPLATDAATSEGAGDFVFPDFAALSRSQAEHDTDSAEAALTSPRLNDERSSDVERFFEQISDGGLSTPDAPKPQSKTSKADSSQRRSASAIAIESEPAVAEKEQSPATEPERSSRVARSKSRPGIGKPVWIGAAVAAAIVGGLAIIFSMGPTKPPRPLLTGGETELLVGPNGHFATVTEAIDSIINRPHKARTIKVASGSSSPEQIVLNGKAGNRTIKQLRIICESEPRAVLRPAKPGEPIAKLSDVEDLVIDGVVFDAEGGPTAIGLSGFLVNSRITNSSIQNFKRTGVEGMNVNGYLGKPFVIERTTFEKADPSAVAIHWTAISPYRTSEIRVHQARFLGPLEAGIEYVGPAWNTSTEHSIFHKLKSAVRFAQSNQDVQGLEFDHNTFSSCDRGLVFAGQPAPDSSVRVQNNLFVLQAGPESVIETGWTAEVEARLLREQGASQNWSDRTIPDTPEVGVMDIFQSGGRRGVTTVDFASTKPDTPDFLKPIENSVIVRASGPGTTDGYVGAIEP
jgi:eukaryotic-like serine/threonine-protein kinase